MLTVENNAVDKPFIAAIAVFLVITIAQLSVSLYMPSMPVMRVSMHTTSHLLQLTVAMYLFGIAVSPLCYGPLSDRFGRRKILLFGLSVYLLGSLLTSLATTINFLLLARLLQGLGIGAASVLGRAVLRDIFSGHKLSQWASYISIAAAFTPAISPALGGAIQDTFNWHANFYFLLGYAALIAIFVCYCFPETLRVRNHHAIKPKLIITNYCKICCNRTFIGFAFISALVYTGLIAYNLIAPFLLQDIVHLSASTYGLTTIITALGFLFGNLTNCAVIKKLGTQRVIKIGIACMLIGSFGTLAYGLANIITVTSILLPAFIFMFGGGIIYPNCLSCCLMPFPDKAGFAAALLISLQMLVTALANVIVSTFHLNNQIPLALSFIVLSVLIIGLYYYSVRKINFPVS